MRGFVFLIAANVLVGATFTVTNTADAGAGSLRTAITNANATPGADLIAFNIPLIDGGYNGSWWTIALASALPTITDAVTIDGTTQTSNVGDTNPGLTGTGGTVGVDAIPFPQVQRPEIAVYGSNMNMSGIVSNNADTVIVKGIAIYGFREGFFPTNKRVIWLQRGTGHLIEGCLVGLLPNGSPPAQNDNVWAHVELTYDTNSTITGNILATNGAWQLENNNCVNTTVTYNEVYGAGLNGDGLGTGSGYGHIYQYNLSRNNGGCGIDISGSAYNVLFDNNTIHTSGGIIDRVNVQFNGASACTDFTFSKNIIRSAVAAGLVIGANAPISQRIRITQNSFYSNGGLGIDLDMTDGSNQPNGDGVTLNDGALNPGQPNNGMDYPVIQVADYDGANLNVSGYIGTAPNQAVFGNSTVEFFKAELDPSGYGEGRTYVGSLVADPTGNFSGSIPTVAVVVGDSVTATATDPNGNTSEFSQTVEITNPSGIGIGETGRGTPGFSLVSDGRGGTLLVLPVGTKSADVRVFNAGGAMVRSFSTGRSALLSRSLSSGVYVVRAVSSDGARFKEKFVVSR